MFFRLGPSRLPRLFLAVHHLVMDGVSWRIVLDDLATAYAQLTEGRDADLGAKTSSYQQWAERLTAHCTLRRPRPRDRPLGGGGRRRPPAAARRTRRRGRRHLRRGGRHLRAARPRAETEALLQRVPAAYRTQINDVLLAALGRVLRDWTGDPVTVALEGHGREELFDDVDLSRTVGWFTTIHPSRWTSPTATGGRPSGGEGAAAGGAGPRPRVRALRHLSEPGGPAHTALATAPHPEISFNYLGQWDGAADGGLVRGRLAPLGADQAPDQPRPHLVDIVAAVGDGEHCASTGSTPPPCTARARYGGSRTRSSPRCAGWWSTACGPAAAARPRPTSRSPASTRRPWTGSPATAGTWRTSTLTPLQSGMLFHTLSDPGAYTEQMSFELDGVTDPALLARAWQEVADHAGVLRASLEWRDVERPLMVVHRRADLPVTHLDWRAVPAAEREEAVRRSSPRTAPGRSG